MDRDRNWMIRRRDGGRIVALSSVDSEAALRDVVMGTGAGAPGAPDA